ncbi:hypothetical protein BDZ91DRAFT_758797 [Kalaharituber pfeilii]|nr:hypothetical protein BDZ91DRAFT_758797 [Kalaharituber pfeilii]
MSQLSTFDHPTSTSVQGIKIRRSFSISNILHSPRLPSRHSRRHSSAPACNWIPQPTPYHTPSENFPPSPLPRPYPSEFQHLPPIQSVSVLNCDIEQEATTTAPICDERDSPSDSSSVCGSLVSCEEGDNVNNENNNDNANDNDNNNDNGNILQTDSIYGPHRLSLLTNAGSERASTLIGSDDGLAIENPYDSVRTRVNEGVTPPVRVESLFDLSSSPPDMSASVALKKTRGAPFVDEIDNVSPTSDVFRGLTPPPVKLDEWLSNRQDDNDDINWGSDWEMPKNSRADDVPFGGVPMNARRSESSASFLKAGLRHDNGSRSSFEDWTTEWDNGGDSNSNLGSSPASIRQGATTWRSKTTYTKGKSASTVAQKEGSAPNSLHTRSQSLPVRSSARHMASESWDSDFEDDESGLGGGEVVVPQAIQERQQKVLRHLDSVKEFAALVQELKKLHELALSTGVRWGQHEKMWDEAEGIIALASVGAEEEEKRGRQRDNEISGLSSLNDESTDEDEDVRRVMSEESRNSQITVTTRRTSILLPDDDIFGGNNLESLFTEPNNSLERLPSRHVKSYSTSSTDSRKAATIGRSDPLALARSIMERIQRGPSDSLYPGTGSSTMSRNSKVHFDTKMLGPLLEKVRKLLGSLQDTLKDEGEFGLYRC